MITLKGPTLGDTIWRCALALLIAFLVVQFVAIRFGLWRAGVWKERAQDAAHAAETAQANADSANAGAANASLTRQQMDAGTVTVRVETEQSAQRIEAYADRPLAADDLDPVDADVVRELEAAESRARAAADRLQRKGTR